MKNNNKAKVIRLILNAVIILLALLATVSFVIGVIQGELSFAKDFIQFAGVIISCLIFLSINNKAGRRMSLDMIEQAYKDDIGEAFCSRPFLRKKLLCAIRLYNESNYAKAIKYLSDLVRRAEVTEECTTAMIFIALSFSDAGLYSQAIEGYNKILEVEPARVTAHSNLGMLYTEMGEYEKALECYNMALAYDREHYYAYSNRANCYFKMGRDDLATEDALRALEIKNNGREAAGLLYVLYSLSGDMENRDKYCRVAVNAGASCEILDMAVESYRSKRAAEVEKASDIEQ